MKFYSNKGLNPSVLGLGQGLVAPCCRLVDGHAAVRESGRSGLFFGGRADVTESSMENDGVGCGGSGRLTDEGDHPATLYL